MPHRLLLLLLLLLCGANGFAQTISTVAGTPGSWGYTGDGGAATAAKFYGPYGVASDKKGNLYIADAYYHVVRKVTTAGTISTFAGNGTAGNSGDGGPATAASIETPYGLAVDTLGNVYISDVASFVIRKVDPSGIISTYAGTGTMGFSGDGGPASSAQISQAYRLALDQYGNLFFPDYMNARIRKISSSGIITTVAGNGSFADAGDSGPALAASTQPPYAIAVDVVGNIYFSNNFSHYIRKIDASGTISTIAGTGTAGFSGDGGPAVSAELSYPDGLKTDACGNLYIAEAGNYIVRKINPSGIISTVAGNHTQGFSGDGSPAISAKLNGAMDVALDSAGNLYIADHDNFVIRKVASLAKPAPKLIIGNRTDVSCFGKCDATATGIVSGGTAPYTFSWSNGPSSNPGTALCAGVSSLTVTDANSCKAVDTVIINAPALITSTVSKLICPGDSAFLQSAWRKTAGSYMDTVVAANGCDSVITTSLSFYTPPTASITGVLDICPGGNTVLTGSGATALLWSTTESSTTISVSPSVSTPYWLKVTDSNGCSDTATVTVIVRANPAVSIGSSTAPTCPGASDGSLTASASGGSSPYDYSWNTTPVQTTATAINLKANSYTVSVSDKYGCIGSKSVTLTDPAPITYSFILSSTNCGSSTGSITVSSISGGSAPFEYSVDGAPFQNSSSIGSLAAGAHVVSVRDVFLCQVDRNFTITSASGPTNFTLTATDASCGQANGSISCTNITGGLGPYEYQLDAGPYQTSNNFTGLIANTYSVTVKDKNGCTYSNSVTVNSGSGIVGFSMNLGAETCKQKNAIIQIRNVIGGTAPHSYSIDGLVFQADSNFNSLDSGMHYITVKDQFGCTLLDSAQILNYGGLDSIQTTTVKSTCGNANGSVSLTIYGAYGPFQTSFNSGPFLSQSSYNSIPAGNDSILVRDSYSCTMKTKFTITDIPGPNSFSISTVQPGCNQNNGNITITGIVGGTAPYEYKYDSTGAIFGANTVYNSLYAGVHKFKVKDANGCLFPFTVILSNPPGPARLSVTTTPEDCGTHNGTLKVNSVTGGTSPYTYHFNGGPSQTLVNQTGLDSGNYHVTVYDNHNCSFDSVFHVGFNSGPQSMTLDIVPSHCSGDFGSIKVLSVNGGRPNYQYSLNGGSSTSSDQFTNLHANVYQLSVFDAGGCRKDTTVAVNDQPAPSNMGVQIFKDTCARNTGVIKVVNVIGGTRPFKFFIDSQTIPDPDSTFTGLAGGVHFVTVEDVYGCSHNAGFLVDSIRHPHGVDTIITDTHCDQNIGALKILDPLFFHGGTPPYSYQVGSVKNPAAYVFTGLSKGNYDLIITDAANCQFVQPFTIPNVPGPSSCVVDIHATTCGQSNGWFYVHDVVGGVPFHQFSIDSINFISSGIFPFTLKADTYRLIVKDEFNCYLAQNVVIPDIPGPSNATFTVIEEHCDKDDAAILDAKAVGGTAPFSYTLNQFYTSPSGDFTSLSSGSHQLEIIDSNGCFLQKTIDLQAAPEPIAKFAQSETEGFDPLTVIFTNQSINSSSFRWDFGDHVYSNEISPTHIYQQSGDIIIKLLVEDQYGCQDSTYGAIHITPFTSIYVPNAFTPDGDGYNDLFSPVMFNQQSWKLDIFNRWGELLISLSDKNPIWDGKYKGHEAPEAVYSYHLIALDILGKKTEHSGQVNLIR